jgi:hypothetical protein
MKVSWKLIGNNVSRIEVDSEALNVCPLARVFEESKLIETSIDNTHQQIDEFM